MFSKLMAKLESFFAKRSYRDWCYSEMEKRGSACNHKCNGQMGGDHNTGYLSYTCIDCKYLDSNVFHSAMKEASKQ